MWEINRNEKEWIFYMIAGVGAGIITGLAGLTAALVVTPILFADIKRGGAVTITAFLGSVLGSFCGYLFQPTFL